MRKSSQSKKSKFRSSAIWKKFRKDIADDYNKIDPITQKKLRTGYNVHHMDLNPDHYENLEEDNFVPLNRETHKVLHWLYTYYKSDKYIIGRLTNYLDKMERLNDESKKK